MFVVGSGVHNSPNPAAQRSQCRLTVCIFVVVVVVVVVVWFEGHGGVILASPAPGAAGS